MSPDIPLPPKTGISQVDEITQAVYAQLAAQEEEPNKDEKPGINFEQAVDALGGLLDF